MLSKGWWLSWSWGLSWSSSWGLSLLVFVAVQVLLHFLGKLLDKVIGEGSFLVDFNGTGLLSEEGEEHQGTSNILH
jgi:hypothetical protein